MRKIGTPTDLKKWFASLEMTGEVFTVTVEHGKAVEGTDPQNRLFHKLLTLAWKSGAFSDPSKEALKTRIKIDGGAKVKVIPSGEEKYLWVQSWANMTKAQRKQSIDLLIGEMLELGATSPELDEIIKETK